MYMEAKSSVRNLRAYHAAATEIFLPWSIKKWCVVIQ